jgi:hypothetical protein
MASRVCWIVVGLLSVATATAAAEPERIPADRVIGSVYGKSITAGDVGLTAPIDVAKKFDARDDALWEQMGRIQAALGGPVLAKFVRDRKVAVTDAEVKRFAELARKNDEANRAEMTAKLAEIKKLLAGDTLSQEERAKREQERQSYETSIAALARLETPTVEFLKPMLLHWKTQRELQRKFGGRVIFQQFGAEALDATKKLFEEAERAGDLQFDDPGVRHLFYYYANMKHLVVDALPEEWRIFDEAK